MIRALFFRTVTMAFLASNASLAMASDQVDCGSNWAATEASGVAISQGLMAGIVTIVVDVNAWNLLDFQGKDGLAATYNCAMLGPDGAFGVIEFVSNMTNNRLGLWTEANGLTVMEP